MEKHVMNLIENRNIILHKIGSFLGTVIHRVITFGLCFVILLPIFQKLSTAFMSNTDIVDITVVYLPKSPDLSFLQSVIMGMDYPTTLVKTLLLSLLIAITQTMTCAVIGYGLARFKFPGRNFLFGALIFSLVVPPAVYVIPQYTQFVYFDPMGLFSLLLGKPVSTINTVWPLMLTGMTGMGIKNALYIYLIRQSYQGLPVALEEAAMVDGSNAFKTFFVIALPSAKPILTTCFLFSFVWQWTDNFYSTYYNPKFQILANKLETVYIDAKPYILDMLGLVFADDQMPMAYQMLLINCGVLLMIAPLLILYLFCQKNFVESIEKSGIK